MSKNHQLFSIPIYQTKVKSNNFLKRMVLDSILDAAQYPHEIPPNWRTPKVKTSFVSEPKGFDIIRDNYNLLCNAYVKCLDDIIKCDYQILDCEYQSGFDIWYNVYTDGEMQEPHNHVTHSGPVQPQFSCIHFLSFEKGVHAKPIFHDPLQAVKSLSTSFDDSYSETFDDLDIEEGDFIMFPSYLRHEVPKSPKTDYPRVTLTVNFSLSNF